MLFSKAPRPAAKPIRIKTYSGQTGVAYQYYFVAETHAGGDRAYHFQVSADARHYAEIRVQLPAAVLTAWQQPRQRVLSETECYAVAKLVLFQAFDTHAGPAPLPASMAVTPAAMESIAVTLDFI